MMDINPLSWNWAAMRSGAIDRQALRAARCTFERNDSDSIIALGGARPARTNTSPQILRE
ncbi:hypothetical protein C7R54_00260 [Achromobacter aloeverae]|uniref:Uncharacterized protein n=1 Tax=Achromobacter aloeverae TaxID=1750518 RepID=A0A4Q1HMX9_9BURK|nr:hypothetical protein C7R54_00260 [Achromobacter aloeverae]